MDEVEGMMQLRFRALDKHKDWMFFDESLSISMEDRTTILPLEESSSRLLWAELVSADPRERHPMLLPRDHWIGNIVSAGSPWHAIWNDADLPDIVADFLRSRITWPETTEVFFFWSRENAVRVPWGVFLRVWKTFLFDDEGPFLVCLEHPDFVCFGPTGGVGVGQRRGPCVSRAKE
jgi:hypothetical protein